MNDIKASDFKVGDKVSHPDFGSGEVIDLWKNWRDSEHILGVICCFNNHWANTILVPPGSGFKNGGDLTKLTLIVDELTSLSQELANDLGEDY